MLTLGLDDCGHRTREASGERKPRSDMALGLRSQFSPKPSAK